MVFTKRTIAELESIQCMVGRFILQVLQSTSIVLVWFDAGLMPIEHRIQCREAVLIWKISKTKNNDMLIYVLSVLLESPGDPWVKSWMNLQNDIGVIANYEHKQALVKAMSEKGSQVCYQSAAHPFLYGYTSAALVLVQIQPHVTESKASKTLSMVRGGNAQLGNR